MDDVVCSVTTEVALSMTTLAWRWLHDDVTDGHRWRDTHTHANHILPQDVSSAKLDHTPRREGELEVGAGSRWQLLTPTTQKTDGGESMPLDTADSNSAIILGCQQLLRKTKPPVPLNCNFRLSRLHHTWTWERRRFSKTSWKMNTGKQIHLLRLCALLGVTKSTSTLIQAFNKRWY